MGGTFEWIPEPSPSRWDADKQRIVGAESPRALGPRYAALELGALVPGKWFRVEADGEVLGYGWMDVNWGDAEILMATAKERRGEGIGTFILERLRAEAAARGLRYVTNVVRPEHPDAAGVIGWLERRGFRAGDDGRYLRAASQPSARLPETHEAT